MNYFYSNGTKTAILLFQSELEEGEIFAVPVIEHTINIDIKYEENWLSDMLQWFTVTY